MQSQKSSKRCKMSYLESTASKNIYLTQSNNISLKYKNNNPKITNNDNGWGKSINKNIWRNIDECLKEKHLKPNKKCSPPSIINKIHQKQESILGKQLILQLETINMNIHEIPFDMECNIPAISKDVAQKKH